MTTDRPAASPLRLSIASVAIIRQQVDGETLWLGQWNGRWHRYNFIAGHKRSGESFHECVVREIGEELGLSEGVDCHVAEKPLCRVEFDDWSESAQAETHYVMEMFETALVGDEAYEKVNSDPDNRWLSLAEICAGYDTDNRLISKTMMQVVRLLHLDGQ